MDLGHGPGPWPKATARGHGARPPPRAMALGQDLVDRTDILDAGLTRSGVSQQHRYKMVAGGRVTCACYEHCKRSSVVTATSVQHFGRPNPNLHRYFYFGAARPTFYTNNTTLWAPFATTVHRFGSTLQHFGPPDPHVSPTVQHSGRPRPNFATTV